MPPRGGIALHVLHRVTKSGRDTLFATITSSRTPTIHIPVRMDRTAAPARRRCTYDFKITVINRWLRQHGARKRNPATVMLGISMDEWQRMRSETGFSYTRNTYPLIERRLSRQDCQNTIARAGLPIPEKSSCWFCPYHSMRTWRAMHDRQPGLFAQAVRLERILNAKRALNGRDPVWLTDRLKPLDKAVGDGIQPSLFDDDTCESGYCMV